MEIKYDDRGLIPAIAQDYLSGKVLMQAYMNRESLELSINSGEAHYFSRSRQELWKKGESSGNIQKIKEIAFDCDGDCILLKVEQTGNACHTGEKSCFYNILKSFEGVTLVGEELTKLYEVIRDRKSYPRERAYTNYLFDKGIDKILKKVGEETSEVIIAAKNNSREELVYEVCDLIYHLNVLLVNQGIGLKEIVNELAARSK